MLIGRLPETIKKCGDSALGGSLSRCEIGTIGSSKDREVPLTALLGLSSVSSSCRGCSGVWGQCCSDGGCRMLGPPLSHTTHLHIGLITNTSTSTPVQLYPHCAQHCSVCIHSVYYIIDSPTPTKKFFFLLKIMEILLSSL